MNENISEATGMQDASKVISAFTAFKFIKIISEPFTKMEAYKLGIIDDKGKFLKKVEDLDSQKEKKSVDVFNRLMINLKKIINKVPDPKLKAQLKTLPTAMILLKDEAEKYGADGEYVLSEVEYFDNEVYSANPYQTNNGGFGDMTNYSNGETEHPDGFYSSANQAELSGGGELVQWVYRITSTFTATSTSSNFDIRIIDDGATTPATYAGDGTSGYFLWGAQLEAAATATTYLPTTTAALVGLTGVTRGANGTTAQSASSGDSIQQLPYALSEVNMPTRLKGLSVTSDGTGVGRLTLCDKIGTTLCDVDIPDNRLYELSWDGGIIFPNGIYVANSDNITAYTLFTDKHSGPNLGG